MGPKSPTEGTCSASTTSAAGASDVNMVDGTKHIELQSNSYRAMSPSSQTAPIMLLPPEITICAFRMLDLRSLLRCQSICRDWYKLIRNTVQLQYDIELELHGLEDSISSTASINDRLDLLRSSQAVWRKSAFGRPVAVISPRSSLAHTSFDKGAILVGEYDQTEIRINRVHLEAPYVQDIICSVPLDPNRRLKAFTLDPSQDAIAILTVDRSNVELSTEVCLQIRSLKTGQVHPLAGPDTLHLFYAGRSTANVRWSYPDEIQFAGNLMRVSFLKPYNDGSVTLLSIFWDWKTGIQYTPIQHVSGQTYSTLIDEEYAILGKPNMYTGQGRYFWALLVFNPAKQTLDAPTRVGVVFECAFLLPACPIANGSAGDVEIHLRAPSPGCQTMPAFRARDDADRLITANIASRYSSSSPVRLLISYARIVAMVRKKAKRSMVPWSEWKDCVVWIGTGSSPFSAQTVQNFVPPQHTAGMRIVTARPVGDDRCMPWSLCAMDFNSWRVARALTEGLNAGESVEHSSSISASEGLFEDDIVIEYPYLKKTAEITPPAHAGQYYEMVATIIEDGVFIVDEDHTAVPRTTISRVPFGEESTGATPT